MRSIVAEPDTTVLDSNGAPDAPLCVHIIDELPPDGAERLIADIMDHRSDRFRYAVLCIVAGGPLVSEIASAGVPVIVLNRKRGLDLRTLPALYRWLRLYRPRVVHTHLFAADSYGRTAAVLAGVPVIVSTRHNIGAWSGLARRTIARFLGLITSRTIACGDEVGRAMIQNERIPASKTVVISNGINLKRFAAVDGAALRRELQVPRGTRIIGVAGRLHAQKGHLDLLEALAGLRKHVSEWLCVIAGSGVLEPEIRSSIQRLGLENHVRLIGQRRDMPNVLASLDLFVMPSRWEGLPMALLEAMALGIPVIATRVGSVPDVIEDESNGLLLPPGAPDELTGALRRLLSDSALAQRLGIAARTTVEQRFNAEQTARSYEALYCELLAEPHVG